MTDVFNSTCSNFLKEHIEHAADAIRNGGMVIFPTETVYGIGANALSDSACSKIFLAKNRPPDNPLIVHLSNVKDAHKYSDTSVMHNFNEVSKLWPGPLTIILPSSGKISHVATAGLETVGLRIPDCGLARSLIDTSLVPIAAPSANLSTMPSATDASDIMDDFQGKVDVIFNSGPTRYGIESTVILPEGKRCTILRPGIYTDEDLKGFFDVVEYAHDGEKKTLSPGTRYRHYSPRKPLYLCENTEQMVEVSRNAGRKTAFICTAETSLKISGLKIVLGSMGNPYEIAANLYSSLRRLDSMDCEEGIIENITGNGIYLSIRNRIKKGSVPLDHRVG